MFDIFKDIERYKGIPPYASELLGVYQPLLGWQSSLTKKWIQRGGALIDPRIQKILNGRIEPAPLEITPDLTTGFGQVLPLEPGRGKSPYTILLNRDLNSVVLSLCQARVQAFVETHNGRLPADDEWLQVININLMMDEESGDMRAANDIIRERLFANAERQGEITPDVLIRIRKDLLEGMQYESQIAAFLVFYAEGQENFDPNALNQLFKVRTAPPLDEIMRATDPLSLIDPKDKSGALSPVGFAHLFRQYFFDLGTFLGEPVEHVWLAPGTTTELVEVSTRKMVIERSLEETLETTNRAEQNLTLKDELSDAIKQENENSTKLGVANSNTANLYVYQGTVSANFGIESTRKTARESTHKQNREQSEKLSTEIKRSVKSIFKTVTETTDTRSRRYVIQNNGDKLLNYELRRKMRRVGVQVQDIGTRLCWQVFIDDPGKALGLAELVHFAESPELANLKEPEKILPPTDKSIKMTVPFPFMPILDYHNNRAQYEYQGQQSLDPANGHPQYNGKHLGIVKADSEDDDSQVIMAAFGFKPEPPQTGYKLKEVRLLNVQGNKMAVLRGGPIVHVIEGTFDLIMQRVNFGGENVINLEMEIVFEPTQAEKDRIQGANDKADEKHEQEKQRLLQKSYMENVRQRIKDASNILSRPSWDLREEERTVVYRKLIERLMLDSWQVANLKPEDTNNLRISHVRSEIIRAIFDVDMMLYFVAPEWWMPRRHQSHLNLDISSEEKTFSLTENDIVKWGLENREDNYRITEESSPAKFGSSLGWLLQLDGDNLRNAFLNAPWVKAIIPIRPGREKAALNWLQAIEGHTDDGWNTPYLGNDDPEFQGKTIGEVLEIVADRLEQQNGDINNILASDKVFEHGFDHLADGFIAGLPANQIFSQWVSVLPTDQIVAIEYKPTDLLAPE